MWNMSLNHTPEIIQQRSSMRWLTQGETSSQTNVIKEYPVSWTLLKTTRYELLPNLECNKVKNIQVNSWLFFPGFMCSFSSSSSMCLRLMGVGCQIGQLASTVAFTIVAATVTALRWDPAMDSSQSSHSWEQRSKVDSAWIQSEVT